MKTTFDALIICTYQRKKDLGDLLDRLIVNQDTPKMIVIVDATTKEDLTYWNWQREVARKIDKTIPNISLKWFSANPGLTRQRNIGINSLIDQDLGLIHFLDDDAIPNEGYFEQMRIFFQQNPKVLGATGQRLGESKPSIADYSILRKVFERIIKALNVDDSPGQVSHAGQNFVTYGDKSYPVQWLSGCSMTFRKEVFDSNLFDETFSGYSLMEDLDFTFKISKQGLLYYNPYAKLIHRTSAVNRWSIIKAAFVEANNRTVFVKKHFNFVGLLRHILLYFFRTASFVLTSLARRDLSYFLVAVRQFLGLVRGLYKNRYL